MGILHNYYQILPGGRARGGQKSHFFMICRWPLIETCAFKAYWFRVCIGPLKEKYGFLIVRPIRFPHLERPLKI